MNQRNKSKPYSSKTFNYRRNFKKLDLRNHPHLYQVGRGEQGVLLVEPYKSEILPHWRFKDPKIARTSSRKISSLFRAYRKKKDFVGMDMARKFLQMGFTRSRRYANHAGGRKYSADRKVLPKKADCQKALSAEIFFAAWKKIEKDALYLKMKQAHKKQFG